jgi:propanol-preferring alcohol dehydrogenase
MRAAVVHDFHQPLRIEERPTPVPGAGQVLVKIEASGLCHTDVHAAHGDWPVQPSLPFVPGHEGVGIVEAIGPGVAHLAEGDRVAVPWLGWACGACEYCASGWETLCLQQRNTGYSIDDGYADYVVAEAGFVGRVPDRIDPLDAAPLTCAGVTTYRAVKVSGARSSDLVAVFGIGALGPMAMQYAQIAAAPKPCEQAFASLRRNGRLVFVGLPRDNFVKLPIFETVLNGITVTGSIVGTRVDLAETFELHADGRTKVVRETRKLEQVNECFDEVLAGAVDARLVFDMR